MKTRSFKSAAFFFQSSAHARRLEPRPDIYAAVAAQLPASPVMLLARWVELLNVMAVQCAHYTDPGEHRWPDGHWFAVKLIGKRNQWP
jgi:hypothetical protein